MNSSTLRLISRAGLIASAGLGMLASCASAPAGETRTFDVVHRFEIDVPAGTQELRAWFAMPDDREPLQKIDGMNVKVGAATPASVVATEIHDALGNRFLYVESKDAAGKKLTVETDFKLTRMSGSKSIDPASTRPLTDAERKRLAPYLRESTNVRMTPEIAAQASAAVGGERNPIAQARLLYDWVLGHVQYWVKDPAKWKASSTGNSVYAFEQCTGNCTDFHSLYCAAALAVGLPTRMVYGSFLKGPLEGKDTDQSYHCWVEFYAPKVGWVPIDVAIADLFVDDFSIDEANASKVALTLADGYGGPDAALVDYYFGNLEARRVTWHRGRDLVPEPAPAAGPINALPKAHVEADGKPIDTWTRSLTFHEER
jgi:transglutaminase-like putative cysteine protease